jgi:ribosomal protein S12 methylthiotransferase
MDYIMRIQKKISENNLKKFLGKKLDVLIEEKKNGTCIGRTEFDAPEVDGQIFVSGKNGKAGDIKKVLVTDAYEYDLAGKFI